MGRILIFSLVIIISISACTKDDELSSLELEITSGFICGWCVGGDSIIINQNEYVYVKFIPCPNEDHLNKNGSIDAVDWNELVRNLDFDTFKSIDLNQCNVCVDGCDNWVKVRQGDEVHQIRFGHSPSDSLLLESIMPFIEKLDELKVDLIEE